MALVHPTSENLREPNKFTDQVYEVAGPDLLKEVKNEILRKSHTSINMFDSIV